MPSSLKIVLIILVSAVLCSCVAPKDWIAKEEVFFPGIVYSKLNNEGERVVLSEEKFKLNENHIKRLDGNEQTFFQMYYGGYFSVFTIQNPTDFDAKIKLLKDFIHWSSKDSRERTTRLKVATIFPLPPDEGYYSFINVNGEPYLQAVWGNGSNSYFPTHNFNIVLDVHNVKLLLERVEIARHFTFR